MSYLVQIVEQHFTPTVSDPIQQWDPLPVGAFAYTYYCFYAEERGRQEPLYLPEAARPLSRLLAWLVESPAWHTFVVVSAGTRDYIDTQPAPAMRLTLTPERLPSREVDLLHCTTIQDLRCALIGAITGIVTAPIAAEDQPFERLLAKPLPRPDAIPFTVRDALSNLLAPHSVSYNMSGIDLHGLLRWFPVFGVVQRDREQHQVLRLYSGVSRMHDVLQTLPNLADNQDVDVLIVRDPLRTYTYLARYRG